MNLLLRGLHPQAFKLGKHSVANCCAWCAPFGVMFAALRAREHTAHARSHHLAFQHAVAGSDSAFSSMRLLAELKEHHGCVNHVSFSSSGAGQQPLLGLHGSSAVKTCWRELCADAE